MKLLIDENLPAKVAELFRHAGHDAVGYAGAEVNGFSDAAVASACQASQRCFVTLDGDFANIRAYLPQDFPGLIVIRMHSLGRRGILKLVPRLITALRGQEIQGQLWIVERNGIRVRGGKP
jgi:predicted nuclease of predicted toxin-antitoxin system